MEEAQAIEPKEFSNTGYILFHLTIHIFVASPESIIPHTYRKSQPSERLLGLELWITFSHMSSLYQNLTGGICSGTHNPDDSRCFPQRWHSYVGFCELWRALRNLRVHFSGIFFSLQLTSTVFKSLPWYWRWWV